MATAYTSTQAGEVSSLAAGVYAGHVVPAHTGCTLKGAGIGRTIIRPDGEFSECVRPKPGSTAAVFTLEDLTIDAQALSALSVGIEVGGGIDRVICRNVEVLDVKRSGISVYNRGSFLGEGLSLVGNAGHIQHHTGSTSTMVRGCSVVGGRFGFVNTAAQGIDLADMRVRLDHWALPTYEAVTVTSYDAKGAVVASHVAADRASADIMRHLLPVATFDAEKPLRSPVVRLRDRIETADGRWTQIVDFAVDGTAILDCWRAAGKWRPVETPSALATVYRVILGRLVTYTSTRLDFQHAGTTPKVPRWRFIDGSTAPTPKIAPGSRLDLIRHDTVGGNRDTDTGAFHVTEDAVNARIVRCTAIGGASDNITLRGVGSVADGCSSEMGYDMGFTIDGTKGRVTTIKCQAKTAGRTGFHLTGGPSDLFECWAAANGTINDGSGDFGVTTTSACAGSTLQVRGEGNLDGLLGGLITEASPGGWEPSERVAALRHEERQMLWTMQPSTPGRRK